jgi:hypothetical protein
LDRFDLGAEKALPKEKIVVTSSRERIPACQRSTWATWLIGEKRKAKNKIKNRDG